MMRNFLKYLALHILLFTLPFSAYADDKPLLRENIIVYGDIVTLGDLFENAGIYKTIPVFRSPDLGSDGVISASRVQAAAKNQGLEWGNPGDIDKIIVRRPSRLISIDDIKKLLKPSLSDKTGIANTEDMTITFATGTKDIHLDSRITSSTVIMSLWHNPQNNAFKAHIGTAEVTGNVSRGVVSGRVDQTSLVVISTQTLEPGKEIQEEGLKTVRLPVSRIRTGAITDKKVAVGKTPKFRMAPNQVLRSKDLEVPKIIRANDLVEIRYQVPGLFLKAQGRALGSGAKGDVISVLNTRSNRKIQARIVSPGVVSPADSPIRIIRQPGT